jgi:hypothetical protein
MINWKDVAGRSRGLFSRQAYYLSISWHLMGLLQNLVQDEHGKMANINKD